MPSQRYHPDVLIFVILIPVISAINYYLTYTHIRLNLFLALTFLLDTAQGYAAWWVVRKIILYLDRVMPLEQNLRRRLLIQLATTTFAGLLTIALLTEISSFVVKGRAAPLEFYSVDLVIISIWFFVINGIYISLYYANLWKQSRLALDTPQVAPTLIARMGKESVRLEPDQLLALYIDDHYVVAIGTDGRKHFLDQSLDKLEKLLPPREFFRLNRQCILRRKAVAGFRRLENGKLSVLSQSVSGVPDSLVVSRLRAVAFKEWFQGKE